ncbi:hypothetical protein HUG10_03545 [Halorarum halophilum]|uniref:Uncharacterized protein n=1 Tax=Halorarum halophilum TaxID=2743090 RepID=A0A7D5GE58_9EURY|nr:hypothetical protein [Halobaculum halophilum]QLG26670.1 hypothetical protein HUG10_03545 [Halobaculum halophilum]
MAVADGENADEGERRVAVAALRSSPGRTVFTEDGNCDGWISTDLTLDVER